MRTKTTRVLVASLCFFHLAFSASAAMPSAKLVESVIRASKDVKKNLSMNIGFNQNEVLISTYTSKGSKDIVKDCKIDAVLFAKIVIGKFPEVSRVIVDFHSTIPSQKYYEVAVSKMDIVAFGSGQVSIDDLLRALKFDTKSVATAIAKSESSKAAGKNSKDSSTSAAQPLRSGDLFQWKQMQTNGISFEYPSAWNCEFPANGYTIAKFKTRRYSKSSSKQMQMTLSRSSLPLAEEAENTNQRFSGQPNIHLVQKPTSVRLGARKDLDGITQAVVSSQKNGSDLQARRSMVFEATGKTFKIVCQGPAADQETVNKILDHICGSVKAN